MPPSRSLSIDRKSTRLNSSHLVISYAVFCLKKKVNAIAAIGGTPLQSSIGIYCGLANEYAEILNFTDKIDPLGLLYLEDLWRCFFFLIIGLPPRFTLFPSTTLFQ